MNTLDRIREVALAVRDWAEEQADKHGRDPNLRGYCAIASAELHNRLKAADIAAEIQLVDAPGSPGAHAFVMAEDYVVDVTATQFGEFRYEPIVIVHECEAQQHWFYNPNRTFKSSKDLRRYQTRVGWPQNQIAIC